MRVNSPFLHLQRSLRNFSHLISRDVFRAQQIRCESVAATLKFEIEFEIRMHSHVMEGRSKEEQTEIRVARPTPTVVVLIIHYARLSHPPPARRPCSS
jgi:hypothetical protein